MRTVTVGTRGSKLALIQTREIIEALKRDYPDLDYVVKVIRTRGDKSAAPIETLGQGVFVEEIETHLRRKLIDIAVHSLKDLPPLLPSDLQIGAVPKRLDARDVLINKWNCSIYDLPVGARIGTSSPRRKAQLLTLSPKSKVIPMRGNVETRINKASSLDYDGAIVAAAGVIRLGLQDLVSQYLPPEEFIPAAGQGALAVEVRKSDEEMNYILNRLDHGPTRLAITAERAFLVRLGTGCGEPTGAYARLNKDTMILSAFMASPDGEFVYKTKAHGRSGNPHEIAMEAHQRLIEKGAEKLLRNHDNI